MTMLQSNIDKMIEMRLTSMAHAYKAQDYAPHLEELDFDERLAMLIDAEWDSRQLNRRLRLLHAANFAAPEACIEDVCYDRDRNLDKSKILKLSTCQWIKDAANLIITGATGAGKTWLACALGVAACNMNYSAKYIRLPEMLDDLCVKKDEDWQKAKREYIKCRLLIIDDWALNPIKAEEARELFEIVEQRYKRGSIILCSQVGVTGWSDRFEEPAIAEAIIDRVYNYGGVIHIEGEESMRKKKRVMI